MLSNRTSNSASFFLPANTSTTIRATASGYVGNFAFTASYARYADPADEELTVEQTDGTQPAARSSQGTPARPILFTARLYDGYGRLRLVLPSTSLLLRLPTAALPASLYVLHLEADGVTERH